MAAITFVLSMVNMWLPSIVDSADPEDAPVGDAEEGASTAEYGIVMLAAVGFAGLLVVILKSDEVRSMLLDIVRNALSIAGNTGLM